MLNQFIINIFDINSIVESEEIKIYNKDDTTKFGIKKDSIIITGESKTYIDSVTVPFGITSIKLIKQLLANKDIKEKAEFRLVSEINKFTDKEEISTLEISTEDISAEIRLASEEVLAKIPIIKSPSFNIAANDVEVKGLEKFIKSVDLLQNSDEYFAVLIDSTRNALLLQSGKKGHNVMTLTAPFNVDSSEYASSAMFKCKDLVSALKIASKFEKFNLKINNNGLISFICENSFVKITINIRGIINQG